MKKAKSHQIDEQGRRLLGEQLPQSWVLGEQIKDYGKDYLVEIADEDGNLTGVHFLIQLKSTERAAYSKDRLNVSYSLEEKYARYYSKIHDLPVFFVVADVTDKCCYFLFLQKWLESHQQWLNQRSSQVNVPTTQNVADSQLLTQKLTQAQKWLRTRYPNLIQEVIDCTQTEILSVDNRFEISSSIDNGKLLHTLYPSKEVEISVNVTSRHREVTNRLQNFIEKGETAEFSEGELELAGSPLFEGMLPERVQLKKSTRSARLSLRLMNNNEVFYQSQFDCNVSGGTKLLDVTTKTSEMPIEMKLVILAESPRASKFSLVFHSRQWEGKELLKLPYFQSTEQFLQAWIKANSFLVEIESESTPPFSVSFDNTIADSLKELYRLFGFINQLRQMSQAFNISPIWKVKDFIRELPNLPRLYSIFAKGRWDGKAFFKSIEAVIDQEHDSQSKALRKKSLPHLMLNFQMESEILGQKVALGEVKMEMTEIRLKTSRQLPNSNNHSKQSFNVIFTPTKRTNVQIVRVSPTNTVLKEE